MSEPTTDDQPIEHEPDAAEAVATPRPVSRVVVWAVCGVLIGAFLRVDLLAPGAVLSARDFDQTFCLLPAVLAALCVGQVTLIAVWAALAPGNIVVRLSWSLLLAAAMWYALVLGAGSPWAGWNPPIILSEAILLGAILFTSVVILQVPLWIAKKCFGWRLSRGPEDAEQFVLEDRQFHLRHMFIATFLCAVALSPLRTVLPAGDLGTLPHDPMSFVLLGAVAVWSILTIPCIWWAFASTATLLRVVVGWLFYCVVLTGVETTVLCAILGAPPNGPLVVGATFFVINVTQCVAVFGVLRVFRAMEFRLVRFPRAARP